VPDLLWETRFGRRVLGFEHVIELYKPASQRRYGYYVLPFLWPIGSSGAPI
jgi:uncharacterized protein YcaQ